MTLDAELRGLIDKLKVINVELDRMEKRTYGPYRPEKHETGNIVAVNFRKKRR